MQEAYRPPCSDYSFCCPNWVPPRQGTPLPGYPPAGYPPPPRLDLAGYHPPVSAPWHSGKCCKALWDMGTPPWTDRWKDRRVSKHYLPVVLRTRAVNMTSLHTKNIHKQFFFITSSQHRFREPSC